MAIEIVGWDGQTNAGAMPDMYAGDAEIIGGDLYGGDIYAGDPYYAGDLYSGEAHAGEIYAGEAYAGDPYAYAGEVYAGDPYAYAGEVYAGDHVAYGDWPAYGGAADPDVRQLLSVTGAAPPRRRPMMAHPRRPMPPRPVARPPVRAAAPAPRMPIRRPVPRVQPQVRPQAVEVVDKPGEGLRAWAIGLDSVTAISGGATQTVTTQPQVLFRGERLTVPNDIAGDFLILDLKIGNRSQLASGQFGLPARAYTENAIDNSLHMDTAQISQFIQMLVQNVSTQPRRFIAQIKGKAIVP